VPASQRHGLAAFAACALLAAMAVNRLAPGTLNADTMLQPLMSLQNTTLFFWGQNRLANLIPFLLSWITAPQLNMWAHLWTYAFSFFAFLAVLAFGAAPRLYPAIAWSDRWLVFLAMTAVSLLVLLPQAAAVLLVEGHPYAPSFLLLSIAVLILTRDGAGVASTAAALLCLFAAIGLNPAVALVALSLAVLWLAGLAIRKVAVIVIATIVFLGAWLALSRLGPPPPYSYFSVGLGSLGTDLSNALAAMLEALRPMGLALVAGALGVGVFAGLGSPRRAREWQAIFFLGALAVGWWIAFATNEWVKTANQSHFRYFSVTILALAIAASLLLFSFVRESHRATRALFGAICAAIVVGFLWRAPVAWSRYEVVGWVADHVDFAERNDVQFVVGDYWRSWPTVFELIRRGKPGFGLAWRGEGNRAAIVATIEAQLRNGKTPRALCIAEPASDCIDAAVRVSGFQWVEASQPCPAEHCLVIQVQRAN
jgi:hypothetical protein